MIRVQQVTWNDAEEAIKAVRVPVFIDEQQVPYEIDFDGSDAHCVHWLALSEDCLPIGTARLMNDYHFGRMAVLKPWRKRGVGRAIMLAAIEFAKAQGFASMHLNAQIEAMGFYRQLGFKAYSERFIDAGMPHQSMALQLDAA